MEKIKRFAYQLLNVTTLGRGIKIHVNDFSLRFPTRYYKYFPKTYERSNYKFLNQECRPGNVVIDIGAHIGLFSVRASQLVGKTGKVFAFEPTPATFKLLQKTIRINKAENIIKPVQAAVAEQSGKTKFYIGNVVGDVANSLVNYEDGNHVGYDVDLISLDAFTEKLDLRVNLIKIDAEGAELSVLKGARHLIEDQKPVCILAIHPASILKFGNTNEQIWDFLLDKHYDIYYEDKLIDKIDFCSRTDLFDVHLVPLKHINIKQDQGNVNDNSLSK